MSNKEALIRCPIHGSIPLDSRELKLIDSPFFQRLRLISQLGFASFVFPGAVHSRFGHSIGVAHLAGRVFEQLVKTSDLVLKENYDPEQLNYFRFILRFSALLHDIGHAPFSHAGEAILPMLSQLPLPDFLVDDSHRQATHEDFTYSVILHLAGEGILFSMNEAMDILSVLSDKVLPSSRMNAKNGQPMIHPLLCQLINGEIDVDRMDYLLRDAYYAGVPYGRFDLDRLINSFSCNLEDTLGRFLLTIDGETVPTYESFLLARNHMFYQIYFHKSLGAYTYYLQKVLKEKETENRIDGSLKNFLQATDGAMIEAFRKASQKKWSGKIFHRVPAKNLIRVLDNEPERMERLRAIETALNKNGIESYISYSWNQYSSQIKNQKINPKTVLVLDEEFGRTTLSPLADHSPLLHAKEKLIEITQLYINRENFDQAVTLLQKFFPANTEN